MHATIRLGKLAGVEIGVNWSWIVIFALISYSLGAVVFPDSNPGLGSGVYVAMAAIAALLFFGSLLLHELGHAVIAKREGMEIEGIVLWLFGGVAKFKGLFPSAAAELRIALAGPAVSLAIGVGMLAIASLAPLPSSIDGVITWLGAVNIMLLVFNMLPALPLDGGRVLRALIWLNTGDFTRATAIAAATGRGFGQLMMFGGILLVLFAAAPGGIWLALIGLFVFSAATAEGQMATVAAALRPLNVSDAMACRPITADADTTLAGFISGAFTNSRHAVYPVVDGSDILGAVSYRDVAATPAADREITRIRDVARPVDQLLVVGPGENLGDAAMKLAQDDLGRALVLKDGALAGLLSMTDVARLIELHSPARRAGEGQSKRQTASKRRPKEAQSHGI